MSCESPVAADPTHAVNNMQRHMLEQVVKGGYCIGCGACSQRPGNGPIRLELNEYGMFQASLGETTADASPPDPSPLTCCPFADDAVNEDTLGHELFGSVGQRDRHLGYVQATYAGHVIETGYRQRGSSGGTGSWILATLLTEGLVDAVVHVRPREPTAEDRRLSAYAVSRTLEDVRSGAKSQYYPVEMSGVLQLIRNTPGRYAVVGIPCFLKAIRLLMRTEPVFRERVHYCIGLFCGHLKSTAFAESMAWQCGIAPGNLTRIDFRVKQENRPADEYAVEAVGTVHGEPIAITRPARQLFGQNWGWGLFKYKACDYCDDVVAELADLSIGDAWLPEYAQDWQGTNVLIVRSTRLHILLQEGMRNGQLALQPIAPEAVVRSQEGGFRHRRKGLAYRLALANEAGQWAPRKRVQPDLHVGSSWFRRVQDLRMQLASTSHTAFRMGKEAHSHKVFEAILAPLVKKYTSLYRRGWRDEVFRRYRSVLGALKQRFMGAVK